MAPPFCTRITIYICCSRWNTNGFSEIKLIQHENWQGLHWWKYNRKITDKLGPIRQGPSTRRPRRIDWNNIFNLAPFDRYEPIGDAKGRPYVDAKGSGDKLQRFRKRHVGGGWWRKKKIKGIQKDRGVHCAQPLDTLFCIKGKTEQWRERGRMEWNGTEGETDRKEEGRGALAPVWRLITL